MLRDITHVESEEFSNLLAHSAVKLGYQTERSFPMSSNNPTVASQLFLGPEETDEKRALVP